MSNSAQKQDTGTLKKTDILIVDDDESICKMLKRILEARGYSCAVAGDAEAASQFINHQRVDLIISDIMMPGKSGMQLLEEIKNNHPNTATLMISGQGDMEIAESAISMGAYGYICKPFQKQQVLISVSDALRRRKLNLQNQFEVEDLKHVVKDRTHDLSVANEKLKKTLDGIIKAMVRAVEIRDPYTAGHQQRVGKLAAAIASKMLFADDTIQSLKMAAVIHDIGKISVPAEILTKPTKLSEAEFNIIKEHSATGYSILKEIDFPWPLADIVHQHHEREDGSGYPQGLTGDRILMEAKILAVADVVEAMASHRPYRPALGIDAALEEISSNKGNRYDSDVVDACCTLFENKEFSFRDYP